MEPKLMGKSISMTIIALSPSASAKRRFALRMKNFPPNLRDSEE